ncbi:hypothetical protein ACISK3_13155 [Morganella morganii]|nr:hypothetical protein [Morganella morganii]
MVKKLILISVLLILSSGQLQAREIIKLDIHETGSIYKNHNNKYEIAACKKFVPKKEQIISYFRLAEESKEDKWMHEYYSSCISSGYVKFDDGIQGDWTIQSSGFGYITLEDGSAVYFFHINNSWEDPNAGTYGLDN